ncbi:hypothetical protein J2X16_003626 [Pelomonas aquatica]|uniref:Integrase n=1 Tax=Pelomonas aquatica TaxID=431058 RepID=A0ABU1ZCB0_9BURK|nr:hypothetical protein [Pelomonas aquatica]MDR7298263.1 hypothetical protein [Pelomonas aquatica]
MPKKKSYAAVKASGQDLSAARLVYRAQTRTAEDADIDIRAEFGVHARITGTAKNIILSRALDQGVDDWVFATVDALRSSMNAGLTPATCMCRRDAMIHFFDYLIADTGARETLRPRPKSPSELLPIHVTEYKAWQQQRGQVRNWSELTVRAVITNVKAVVMDMFALGYISGDSDRIAKLFRQTGARRAVGKGLQTSYSDAEQERLSSAIKTDLTSIHHGRLQVSMRELQGLRALLVAHRMGHNTTPLLELTRDAVQSGLLPGTVLIRTTKYRNHKIISQPGRSGANPLNVNGSSAQDSTEADEEFLSFSLAEGAVIQQAIESTDHLLAKTPEALRNRVWLFESSGYSRGGIKKADVSCLSQASMVDIVRRLVRRHELRGDNGEKLTVNCSRFRKSRFDRAYRISGGDLAITANLLGNTPAVAAQNYPTMNHASQALAAEFMNEDYVRTMRERAAKAGTSGGAGKPLSTAIDVKIDISAGTEQARAQTPVLGCSDPQNGEHAPGAGQVCDRFLMCLFCSNFAVVGDVDELWRLFSFQEFARTELATLEEILGELASGEGRIANLLALRERYRIAIPAIDSFVDQQFPAKQVRSARNKTQAALHPFWQLQMERGRMVRHELLGIGHGRS